MELSFKVFEHAAALIGRTPWDVSRDADLLYQAQAAAFRQYRHQPLIVAIDHYNLAPEADRVLAFARRRPNTVLGAGVLPYETAPENIFRLRDYLELAHRQT